MHRTLAVMQPYLFPYIGYYQLMDATDQFIIYDRLNYIKRGYIHRNQYLQPGVGAKLFGAEVQSRSSFDLISDVKLNPDTTWRKLTLKRLESAYARAPWFEQVFPLLKQVFLLETEYLSVMSAISIEVVQEYLALNCILEYNHGAYGDLESKLANDAQDQTTTDLDVKHQRIIEICGIHSADRFVNPIGGINLYNKSSLFKHGVSINFLACDLPKYTQFNSPSFVPSLSIIDMLMNCSVEQLREKMQLYQMQS
jgi:hypothetical protein